MKTPFDYQDASHAALINYLHNPNNYGKNPLVVLATGAGKSLSHAMFIYHMLSMYPHLRMMCLTHVKELVDGNYTETLEFWPSAPLGMYSASLKRKETWGQVTYGNIQSVHRNPATWGHIDFLLIDEAHLVSDTGMYFKFITALRKKNPNLIVIGFTATHYRMKQGLLTEGEDALFDEVVFDLATGDSFVWLVDNYYLCEPLPQHPGFELETDDIKITGGEFNNKDAALAIEEQNLLERAVDTTITTALAEGRRAWLTFNQSVEQAKLVADMYTYKGYPHEAVYSGMSDRDAVQQCFRDGGLRGLTNMNILTTGSNFPIIDMLSAQRLTRSVSLWVQMVGRGTRQLFQPGFDLNTFEGRKASYEASPKKNCRVLDFVGNTKRLGPINYPKIPGRRKKGGGGEAPVRTCPDCGAMFHPTIQTCPECGYEFPPPQKLQMKASEASIMARFQEQFPEPKPKEFMAYTVYDIICERHAGREDKPDTLKVTYRCGSQGKERKFSTWLCFDHPRDKFPYRKACDWWSAHKGGKKPLTVQDAIDGFEKVVKPMFIKVWVNTKYPEIDDYDFAGGKFMDHNGEPLVEKEQDPNVKREKESEKRLEEAAARLGVTVEEYTSPDFEIPF